VWDLASGRELRTLVGHTDSILGVAVDTSWKRAISASDGKTLRLWNLEDGTFVASFTCDASVISCAFIDDRVIIAGDELG
jgi:WD40 repeat protein